MTVGFEPTSYTISEDGPLVGQVCARISNLMGELECNLVVTFDATSNNKSGKGILVAQRCEGIIFLCLFVWPTVFGEDFTVESPDVFEATFIAMSTSDGDIECDNGTIIDDDVLEGEHSFEIQIGSTNPQLTNISPDSAIVTIQDNEGIVVGSYNTNSKSEFLMCML